MTAGAGDWFSRQLIGLHLLAIVAVAVCIVMGLWQLGVYGEKHEDEAAAQAKAAPVDLLKVWGPDDAFTADLVDRRVRIDGELLLAERFVVKRPDGQRWLAAPARVKGTKSAIIVVLGRLTDRTNFDLTQPPSTFTAVLQPSEASGELSMAQRVNQSEGDLFSGYALLNEPSYESDVLLPVRTPDPDVSWTVGLRNLAYALQWWVFGLFAAFMWWRMATDALEVQRASRPAGDGLPS